MTGPELKSYRMRLLAMKKRLASKLTELEEEELRPVRGDTTGGLSDVPIHSADVAASEYDEEVVVGLLENESQLLTEVNDALERIERGTFGRCEECRQQILRKRLKALPYARYCLRHARKLQSSRMDGSK